MDSTTWFARLCRLNLPPEQTHRVFHWVSSPLSSFCPHPHALWCLSKLPKWYSLASLVLHQPLFRLNQMLPSQHLLSAWSILILCCRSWIHAPTTCFFKFLMYPGALLFITMYCVMLKLCTIKPHSRMVVFLCPGFCRLSALSYPLVWQRGPSGLKLYMLSTQTVRVLRMQQGDHIEKIMLYKWLWLKLSTKISKKGESIRWQWRAKADSAVSQLSINVKILWPWILNLSHSLSWWLLCQSEVAVCLVGYLSSHVHKVYVLIMIIQLSEEQSLQVLPSPQIHMQQQTDLLMAWFYLAEMLPTWLYPGDY